MGVITPLSLNQVWNKLNTFFAISAASLHPTSEGITDTSYIVEDQDSNKYFLKVYEESSPTEIEQEVLLLNDLRANDFPVPKPIPYSDKNRYVFDLCSKPACLFSYLKGETGENPKSKQIAEIGGFLGKFHRFTFGKSFSKANIYTSYQLKRYLDTFKSNIFNRYRYFLEETADEETDGIIHGDLFPDNSKFIGDKLTGVLDFTGACNGSFYFDLAVVIISWCVKRDELNLNAMTPFLNSYKDFAPNPLINEKKLLKWMKFAALFYASQRYYMQMNKQNTLMNRDYEEYLDKLEHIDKSLTHGGNIYHFAELAKCPPNEVIDFSSNINFLKPEIKVDLNKLNISPYPDPDYNALTQAFISKYSIPESCSVEFFNGASSGIFSLFRFLNIKHCSLYAPIYLEYKKAAGLFCSKTRIINRFDDIHSHTEKESLVVFVNPSTPDGKLYNLDKLFGHLMGKNSTIIVDESFLDFTSGESALSYPEQYNRLYVIKSLTKFYSSAGVRVGAVISGKENIEQLKRLEPAWKLSTLDSHYMIEALQDDNFYEQSKITTQKNKDKLKNILQKSSFFESIYDSKANYILAKLKNMGGYTFQHRLTRYQILIRVCDNFDFLGSDYIRFAVKDDFSLDKLKDALTTIQKDSL